MDKAFQATLEQIIRADRIAAMYAYRKALGALVAISLDFTAQSQVRFDKQVASVTMLRYEVWELEQELHYLLKK